MIDRQEVLKGLKEIEDEAYCRWVHRPYVPDKLVTLFGKYLPSIIALLKEQEPVTLLEGDTDYICSGCGSEIDSEIIDYIARKINYCPWCGRKVLWDA